MHPPGKFRITETEPTPLVRDFQSFLDYVGESPPYLTPRGYISGRDLFEMNKRMAHPLSNTTVRTGQEFYPQLHLFFHLAQAGRLIQKSQARGDKSVLQLSDRSAEYLDLTATEKYFFLLETLWVDTNWKHIAVPTFRRYDFLNTQTLLEKVATMTPDKPIQVKDLMTMPYDFGYFWLHFAFFGFWTVTSNKEVVPFSKRFFLPGILTPFPFGVAVAELLVRERNYQVWNLPFRRGMGEWNVKPGQPCPEEYIGELEVLRALTDKKSSGSRTRQRDQSGEPFFLPFVPLFAEGELVNALPREARKMVEGTYLFRVALSKQVWRKIKFSSNHTLLTLHHAIQEAFQFDSDHLYSFFMDGIPWSDEKFSSPFEDEGPHADEVRIGELGLTTGQTFLYLFDYGDEWRFHVTLEEIRQDEKPPKEPRIVESKGRSPEQYPDGEEE